MLTFNVLVKKESKYGIKSEIILKTKLLCTELWTQVNLSSSFEDKQDDSVTLDLTVKIVNPASIFGVFSVLGSQFQNSPEKWARSQHVSKYM